MWREFEEPKVQEWTEQIEVTDEQQAQLLELVVDVSVLSDELSEEDVVAEEVVAEEVPPVPEETEPVIPDALFEVPFPDALPVPDVPDEAPSCVPALLSFVPCEVVPDVELSELSVLDDALPEPDPRSSGRAVELLTAEPDAAIRAIGRPRAPREARAEYGRKRAFCAPDQNGDRRAETRRPVASA